MDVSELRVLVVDDEPDIASSIKRLIEKELHCEVEVAESAASARSLFGEFDYDIVTLDYQLPDDDGLTLLVELSALGHPPCSILVTGHGDEQVAAQAFRAGAAGYVVKDSRLPTMLKDSISKAVSHIAFEEAQASLRRSEEQLKLVSDGVPILVARVGPDLRYRYVNRLYSEVFGRPPEWFVGRPIREILGEAFSRSAPFVERALSGEQVEYENHLEIDGEEHVFNVKHAPISDKAGRVTEYFTFIEDITERKRFEERLARERDMLARLMETSPVAILLLGADGRVAYANKEAEEMLVRDNQPLVGRSYETAGLEIFDGGGSRVPGEEHPFKLVLSEGRPISGYQFWVKEAGDRWRKFSLNASPMLDDAGKVEGVIGTVLDITPEAERRSQLEFSEQVLSNVSDAVMALDKDYNITYWSPTAEVVYGWAAGEVLGRNAVEVLRTRLLDISHEEADSILSDGGQFRAVAQQRRKDGVTLDIETQAMAVKDIAGNISGYVSVNRDITERKRLEEHLKAERDLARLIVDTSPVGILLTDSGGRITFMSPRATEILGRSFEEAVGLRLEERDFDPRTTELMRIPPEQMPFAAVERTGNAIYDFRVSFARPDGARVPVSINASPVLQPDGSLRAVVFSLEDIGETLEREEELRRWGFIIGAVDVGIVITNADDASYEMINERYARMHGYSVDELKGTPFWAVIPAAERARTMEMMEEGDKKDHYMVECVHMRKDGSTFPCLSNITCIKGKAGETTHRVVTVQDITVVRRAEAELLRLNSELEGYAHAASHDLRGPLTAINLSVADIRDRVTAIKDRETRAGIEESMETVERNLSKAFTLISELLALAESGQHPPEVKMVEVKSVVRDILEERAHELESKRCRVEVDDDLGSLVAHPVQLYQVFSNVIGNAIVHNDSDHPSLEIRYLGRDSTGANRYVVKDNGPGVPEEALDKIFIPFEGASGAAGSGIGLALVKKVVAVYGGDIELRNQGGAHVEFTLKDYLPDPHG